MTHSPSSPSRGPARLSPLLILAVSVVLVVVSFTIIYGARELVSRSGQKPVPPPSGVVPNAPGPDNTVTSRVKTLPERPSTSQEPPP